MDENGTEVADGYMARKEGVRLAPGGLLPSGRRLLAHRPRL
jgi:hypothetical protein